MNKNQDNKGEILIYKSLYGKAALEEKVFGHSTLAEA